MIFIGLAVAIVGAALMKAAEVTAPKLDQWALRKRANKRAEELGFGPDYQPVELRLSPTFFKKLETGGGEKWSPFPALLTDGKKAQEGTQEPRRAAILILKKDEQSTDTLLAALSATGITPMERLAEINRLKERIVTCPQK